MHSNKALSVHDYPLTLQPACGTEGLSQLLPSAPILVCLRTTTERQHERPAAIVGTRCIAG